VKRGISAAGLRALALGLPLAVFILAIAYPVAAEQITGRVVAIQDGDTLTVLVDRRQVKVRLVEIDAPEKAQAFGNRSKQSLSDLCFNKTTKLDDKGKDRYGRTLARVYCDGVDANAEQVRRGMAWVFDRYARRDSPLYAVQNEARAARRGLWGDSAPVPPWEWRRKQRSTK
jgi:endonuclease YncB( thermonuclease family)